MNQTEVTRLVRWASAEAARQKSGENSVAWMIDGWDFIYPNRADFWKETGGPTIAEIRVLGSLVEPRTNPSHSFRGDNVLVGLRYAKTAPWREVPRLMKALVAAWNNLTADEWYKAFQEIHPFLDGNGRVGSILWNAHRGSLDPDKLEAPPEFWK